MTNRLRSILRQSVVVLALCSAAVTAGAQDRCTTPGMMTLLVAVHVLNFACEELAPETREERGRVLRELTAEFPDCFARAQDSMDYFRQQARATAERILQAGGPPESTTCLEFPARIERVREVNGLPRN